MTLINVAVSRDRAVIAADSSMSDTQGRFFVLADGRPYLDNKLVVLPAAQCVLSVMGPVCLRHRLAEGGFQLTSFDEATERAPAILRAAWPDRLRHAPDNRYAADAIVIIAGWSERRGHMAGVSFWSGDDFAHPTMTEAGGPNATSWRIDPNIDLAGIRMTADPQGMLAIAQRQVERYRAKDPNVPLGGPCVVAELTRDTITLQIAGDLGVPECSTTKETACT